MFLKRRLVDPCEMVDAKYIHLDLIQGWCFGVQILRCQVCQHTLRGEDFVAAAEDPKPGCNAGQRPRADGHRVGVVDDPGVRAESRQGLGKIPVNRSRSKSAYEPGRPSCVTH